MMLAAPFDVVGVDEVGRGPLAGPVCAAAVLLPAGHGLVLRDSKKLSPRKREVLAQHLQAISVWSVAWATEAEIDAHNILQASLLAMQRAVAEVQRNRVVREAWVDGCHSPQLSCPTQTWVKGDDRVDAIAAASIIAKVARDALMKELDAHYPGYGLAQHQGYPTPKHKEAVARLGPSPIHRKSFKGVKEHLLIRTDLG